MAHDSRKRWLASAAAAVLALGTLIAIGAVALHFAPEWIASTDGLGPKDAADAVAQARTAVLAFLAGVVGSVGAVYTARTFGLSRQGQVTERFTRAVDQLGRPETDVRIGGIYALERIARDSSRDHQTVIEVLSAFVRERTREPDRAFPADAQAALTVIGRRRLTNDPAGFRVDLQRADLRNANLSGARLGRALLTQAKLQGAILAEASLREAWFIDAHLEGASLIGADLRGARLLSAHLEYAALYEADLEGAELDGAHLEHAVLGDATLTGRSESSRRAIPSRGALQARMKTAWALPDRVGIHRGPANLTRTSLKGASFTTQTAWPPGFDPESVGAKLVGSDRS